MAWPTSMQYNEAVQNLRTTMSDPELKGGTAAVNPQGLPLLYAGGFAYVYQVHCPATGNTWAVKFFRHVPGDSGTISACGGNESKSFPGSEPSGGNECRGRMPLNSADC